MIGERVSLVAIVVFCGGALGGACRFALTFVPYIGSWPLMTVLINCLGTLMLAALGSYLKQLDKRPAYRQAFIGTGFCGGFTTFGTLIMQASRGWMNGHFLFDFLLLVGTIALALLMLFLGQHLGTFIANRKGLGARA